MDEKKINTRIAQMAARYNQTVILMKTTHESLEVFKLHLEALTKEVNEKNESEKV